jgi:hypothetical protein
MTSFGKDLILKINRPQYAPNPEVFISAMAWRLVDESQILGWVRNDDSTAGGKKNVALIYETTPLKKNPRDLTYVTSRPDQSEEALQRWRQALEDNQLTFSANDKDGAKSIADALRGVSIEKSPRQAATPLSPHIALLQNSRGIFAKNSPPDFALIIEQMFALGNSRRASDPKAPISLDDSAIGLWYAAMRNRLKDDWLLSQIDRAVKGSIESHPLNQPRANDAKPLFPNIDDEESVLLPRTEYAERLSTINLGANTPFAWFNDAWRDLTDEKWVKALPARRWIDWATTVLRMAFGFSYIWEATWYQAVASVVTSTSTELNHAEKCLYGVQVGGTKSEIIDLDFVLRTPKMTNHSAMPWKDADLGVSFRDVAPTVRNGLSRGLKIRQILEAAIQELPDLSIEETLYELRKNDRVRKELTDALKEKYLNQTKSLYEAVKYTLLIRNQNGESADFYGLLKTVKPRFTIIEPATEWIAAISSLAINSPRGHGNLGTLRTSLERLGLRPTVAELTRYLEVAGLAESAADADTAVSIVSAY